MRRRERETPSETGETGDTKVCPYCAEVIKAAAIRCRYCQSDLTAVTVADEPPPPVDPSPVVEPVETTSEEVSTSSTTGEGPVETAEPVATSREPRSRLFVVAAAVAVVLTLVFAGLAFRAWDRERDLQAADEAGRTVRATLPAKLQDVLSYDFQTFDQDRTKALDQLTPAFGKKYGDTLDEIEQRATDQRRSQDAAVVAVAVVRATPDEVTTLVFINRTTSTAGSDKQQVLQDRANVTVVRDDGRWLISDISFPTS